MDIGKELKILFIKEGVGLTEFAGRLSAKKQKIVTVQSVFNKLARNSLKVNNLIEICDVLGYDFKF